MGTLKFVWYLTDFSSMLINRIACHFHVETQKSSPYILITGAQLVPLSFPSIINYNLPCPQLSLQLVHPSGLPGDTNQTLISQAT
jgi:hypothetical protein